MSDPPPPDTDRSAVQPSAPAGQYTPDGRWYWDGRQWIAVTVSGPPWARPYAAPEGRAAAAVAMLALASAGTALGVLVDTFYVITTPATAPGLRVALPLPFSLAGLVAFLLGLVGSAIAVPMRMHRAFRNLPALGEQGMHWSPGWEEGGWFVPLAKLGHPLSLPARAVEQLRRRTAAAPAVLGRLDGLLGAGHPGGCLLSSWRPPALPRARDPQRGSP